MTSNINNDSVSNEYSDRFPKDYVSKRSNQDEILCIHCKRTKDNGITCKGMCVADSEY